MMQNHYFILLLHLLLHLTGLAKSDPEALYDYCVAETKTHPNIFLNSVPCINPDHTLASHFWTSALSEGGSMNQFDFNVTLTNVNNLGGLNTLGLAMARIDIAVNGLVPPHSHPRASELTILLEGSLLVGFVDTSNRLYTQRLRPGDSFVFPKALIHFLYNTDISSPALAVSGLTSQNPGAQLSSLAAFASHPPLPDDVLRKGFKINGQDVARIRRNLGG
ncbi:germin-like protein subfamily 1 member 1 [Salvia miltiorrhiza]|uniref:germin-like protein subfamily 1 member 1 n=1 Tax=Salvia miltiorrhiza TaxID=226208 RepID=UPI0025AB80A4|nr:germin-like protein subfamily 1 member 1 [Salvia miltiorrhiza]